MPVVIDEMITEPTPAAATDGQGASGAGAPAAEPDLDKLGYQIRRARQRAARLFAD